MEPGGVVAPDPRRDSGSRVGPGAEPAAMDELALERGPKRFCKGIVRT